MTSVDDLFKKPNLPSGSIKRKFETPDAQQAYKSTKLAHSSSPNGTHTNGATIEDDATEEEDDLEAGPDLPPEDDDEEGGRFFGGGVTKDAAEALDYIDQQEPETYTEERIDSAWLRRLAVSFEKKVSKNAGLRAKYDNEPAKFMASEADLDAEIKSWSLLSDHPELYAEFAEGETVAMLVGLLAHENTDIAIAAIEILAELLDEDVETEPEQWDVLVAALLEADLLDLLMSNLARLDEEEESDRSGVYHSLTLMESLIGQRTVAEKVGSDKVLLWLCNRIRKPEKLLGQNKQYAAEVLQVLLHSSPIIRKRLAVDLDGIDLFLQILAAYRKRDPAKDTHEEEYAENIFDALTSVVDDPDGKTKFVEAEGVELSLIMLKEGTFSKPRALRLLDHACSGQTQPAVEVCTKLVEAAGLKRTFNMFMTHTDNTTIEHLLGIFASLLRLLPGDSAARIRTLAKFAEKDHVKVDKLIQHRSAYARKIGVIDGEIKAERTQLSNAEVEEREDAWLSRRLDAGLFSLQTIDMILAWLAAEDGGAKALILERVGAAAILESLRDQLDGLAEVEGSTGVGGEDGDTREMLETLIGCLE